MCWTFRQKDKTLSPYTLISYNTTLTGDENDIDYLITVEPVMRWNMLGSMWTVSSQSCVLEAGNMGKCKDLSDFNKEYILMTSLKQQVQGGTAAESAGSWAPKPQWWTWGMKATPSENYCSTNYWKRLTLAKTENCLNTQCILQLAVYGGVTANWSGCPCWPLSITKSAKWASVP